MRRYPLISCIMPTRNRRRYIDCAIESYLRQSWPNKELIVADNGHDLIRDRVEHITGLQYIVVPDPQRTTGEMRNICCAAAKGEYIAHFDDDDWSHPDRLREQYKLLLSSQRPVVGYRSICFIDEESDKAWHFTTANEYDYSLGTALCYLRAYWRCHPFEHFRIGEDDCFVNKALNEEKIKSVDGFNRIVARVHANNTSPKWQDEQWQPITTDQMRKITRFPNDGK